MAEDTTKQNPQPSAGDAQNDAPKPTGNGSGNGSEQTVEGLQEQINDLQAKLTEQSQTNEGLIGQIKDLRQKKQELEQQLEPNNQTQNAPKNGGDGTGNADVEQTVRSILEKQRQEDAKVNRQKAYSRFIKEHPEFQESNDPTGLKADALAESMKRINANNSYTEDDFYTAFSDAYKLMDTKKATDTQPTDTSNASIPTGTGGPKPSNNNKLTPQQDAIRKEKGMTVERYLELKEKYPSLNLP